VCLKMIFTPRSDQSVHKLEEKVFASLSPEQAAQTDDIEICGDVVTVMRPQIVLRLLVFVGFFGMLVISSVQS